MKYEIHYTRIVEANDFFDAVDFAKENIDDIEEVVTICPFVEDMEEDLI